MTPSRPGQNRYITDSTLRTVLARFGVEKSGSIEPMEASKRNDNFLVQGPTEKYVLRRYRRNNDEARVRFQLRFQQHLLNSDFPTSKTVPSRAGDPLVIDDSGMWALFGYVQGDEFDFSRLGQVASAAQRLAQFHDTASMFDEPEVEFHANREWCDWWSNGESEIGKLASMFAGRDVDVDLAFLREWWTNSVQEWPAARVARLPLGWIHGDWHGHNMVFVGDEVRGVFMFGRESRPSRRIRLDVAQLFVNEYERYRSLAPEELKAIPFVMVAHWAPTVDYWRMLERDGEDSAAHLRHTIALMRDLLPEARRLQEMLAGSKAQR